MKKRASEKSTAQSINLLVNDMLRELATWEWYRTQGGQDPFYTDGANMNLIRNHVIYYKREIERLCVQHGMDLPETYFLATPPKVDEGYMARNGIHLKRRLRTILRSDLNPLTYQKVKTSGQLELF